MGSALNLCPWRILISVTVLTEVFGRVSFLVRFYLTPLLVSYKPYLTASELQFNSQGHRFSALPGIA